MQASTLSNASHCQRGVSLIEVLISLLVLSIGLLGSASLQITGLKLNHSSYLRTQAVVQAHDMADRIRANPAGRAAGLYDHIDGIPQDPKCVDVDNGCTVAQIVQWDAYEWNTRNAEMLPAGHGTVSRNGGNYVVTLRWDDEGKGVTGTGCDPDSVEDLKCFRFEFQP